jgi:hypothetical protein
MPLRAEYLLELSKLSKERDSIYIAPPRGGANVKDKEQMSINQWNK